MLINRAELQAIRNHMSNIPSVAGLYTPVLLEWCEALLKTVDDLTRELESARKSDGTVEGEP